ncbi:MAG TPA: glycosyltransferase family 39 protein [Bryobacteraceae bacterium]|nr:glycosyltransferase family 39 protein [Bryobacteraceae bacterium]
MDRPRRLFYLACGIVLLASAIARGWFATREIILDEAWVANSVLEPNLSMMFFYPEWLQTTPPLFLLWLRATVQLFGLSHTTLEIPATIAGVGGVVAVYAIGRYILERSWRWSAVALVALSPSAIFYSTACKQYEGELLISALLLLTVVATGKLGFSQRIGLLLAVGIVAVLMSHGSLFLFPGIALWLLVEPGEEPRRVRILWLCGLAVCLSAVFAAEYLVYIRPNTNAELQHYWRGTPLHSVHDGWVLFNSYLFYILSHYVRMDGPHGWIAMRILRPALVVLYGCGVWALWRGGREDQMRILRGLLLWEAPVFLLMIADVFGVFPFSLRTSLFLVPGLTLAASERLQALARGGDVRWDWAPVALMGLLSVLAVDNQMDVNGSEQSSVAYSVLKRMAGPGDVVFVHRSMRQQFELEAQMQGPLAAEIVFGATGPGCCARPEPPESSEFTVTEDLGRAMARNPTRIWSYHTLRRELWAYLGLEEPKILDAVLRSHGFHVNYQSHLRMVSVDAYERDGSQ